MVSLPDPVWAAGAVYPQPADRWWQQGGVLDERLAQWKQEGALVYMVRLPNAAQPEGTCRYLRLPCMTLHMAHTGRGSTVKGLAVLATTRHYVKGSHRWCDRTDLGLAWCERTGVQLVSTSVRTAVCPGSCTGGYLDSTA